MATEKYACPKCGHDEFVTQPNRYDVFIATEGKLSWQTNHLIDEEIELFCRECGEQLVFAETDLLL